MASSELRRQAADLTLTLLDEKPSILLGFSLRDALVFRQVQKDSRAKGINCYSGIQVYSLGHKKRAWPLYYLIGTQIYRRSVDHVYAACALERRKMISLGLPRHMCSVVHLPLDERWTFASQNQPQRGEVPEPSWLAYYGRPRLVFLGQFNRIKKQRTLIEILSRLLRQYPTASLILAGDGPCLNECREFAERNALSRAVCFAGRLPQSEIPGLLRHCDIAVVASLVETFGYCIAEPFLFDLPVVSTKTGLAGELEEKGALLTFPRGSAARGAEEISRALSESPEQRQWRCLVGKSYVLGNCSSGAVARQMTDHWLHKRWLTDLALPGCYATL
ncbi:MAG: glycosyltransferase family 4 protein [Acidobacteriota bacterium]